MFREMPNNLPRSKDRSEPPPRSLATELRLRSLRVLSTGLPAVAIAYAAIGMLYLIAPPHEPARPFILASTAAAALMMVIWGLLPSNSDLSDRPYSFAWVTVAVAYGLTLVALSASAAQAVILVLTLMVGGSFLTRPGITLFMIATTLGGWFVIGRSFSSKEFILWTFYLVVSAIAAVLITLSRRAWAVRLHRRAIQADDARRLAADHAEKLAHARDAALDSAQAKTRFLANVSHEVRTPLNAILGMLELIEPETLSAPQDDFLRQIKRSSNSLLAIVNDLLDLSKIEAGRMELESVPFDLVSVIEEVATNHAAAASAKGLELYTDIDSDIPDEICGDPLRLRQVIANLVSNAIKFTDHGEVVVSVRRVQRHSSRVGLEFRVSDTGIGIPPDQQKRIFRPFSQADTSTSRQYGGTGLGLSICLQLVQLLGGQLRLDSKLNQGSSFYFTLRFDLDEALSESLQVVSEGLEGMRTLVLEANDGLRSLLRSHLSALGMQVSEASNFKNAVDMLDDASRTDAPFAVAIIDLRTLGSRWESLATELADRAAATGCRVIAVGTDDHAWNRIIETGISVRILKPLRRNRLLTAVLEALKQPEQELKRARPLQRSQPRLRLQSAPGQAASILVAEDNDVNLRVIMAHLHKLGFDAECVRDGQQAVGALSKDHDYDLVLMDIEMPRLNGYQATAAIRELERHHQRRRVPIVALTAHAMKGDRETAFAAGMDDYLAKPYTSQQLSDVIEKWAARPSPAPTRAHLDPDAAETPAVENVLDETTTAQLTELDRDTPGFLGDVIDSFERTVAENIAAMREAIAKEDLDALRRAAHTVKGTSQQLGALHFGGVCRSIEQLDSLKGAQDLVEVAETEFRRANEAFRAVIDGISAAS